LFYQSAAKLPITQDELFCIITFVRKAACSYTRAHTRAHAKAEQTRNDELGEHAKSPAKHIQDLESGQ